MATLLSAISVIVFFVGIAALIRPIPKLKVRTRANALLVIAASFGIALLSGLFVEADSGGVSSDVKLAQGGEAPIPDYEFVSRAEYVGGMGVKVRVPGGLSKEEVGHVIGDAANRYGGNEEDTVWVYREGDDVTLSGYTVAMGERPNRRAKFELAFSDAYFADKTDSDGDKRTTVLDSVPSSASPVVANQSDQLLTFANEIDLSKYLSRCDGATEAIFIRECLGKKVVWEMFFVAGMEDPQVIMGVPGDRGLQSLVSFSSLPDWGDHRPLGGALAWTGRRTSIAARIAMPPHIVDPANTATRWIVLEDAQVVPNELWRDRAVEMVEAQTGVLAAMWPHAGGRSFWVTMANNGQPRDQEASQICGPIWRAGQPVGFGVIVTILDAARIDQQAEMGKALCP